MPMPAKKKVLYIVLSVFLFLLAAAGGFAWWLSDHYKKLLVAEVPGMVQRATDSIYHISFKDINVDMFDHSVTITGLKLWPDYNQAKALRARHHRIPPTLSTVSVPRIEAYGLMWGDIASTKSLNCKHVVVRDLKWLLDCTPHPEDSLFTRDKKDKPLLDHISVAEVDIIKPDVTYHYHGKNGDFSFHANGGTAVLHDWIYNTDKKKDTSLFLYAHSGQVRFDDLVFVKKNGRYTTKKPEIDFETSPNSVTLKKVKIKHMVNHDPKTWAEKEIYDLLFPSLKLTGLNWNELITNTLHATQVDAEAPNIAVRFFDKNAAGGSKLGSYPHQLLLQVGLQTNLETVNLHKGHLKYTEVTEKNEEAVIEFTNIKGHMKNVTNMKEIIASHKTCVIQLEGKYMNKSDVNTTFNLNLADTTGRFSVDGFVKNIDGEDVLKQAQAFTLVEVTSFHLDKIDMHIEGDGTYAKGDFAVLYKDLKISLLKFKSKHRMGKKGPLSFLGSALILYPSNPIRDKEVRTVTTTFARDPDKGFIAVLWQQIYRAAKKTAVRNEGFLDVTDIKESFKGEDPKKKGMLKRLFGKKDK